MSGRYDDTLVPPQNLEAEEAVLGACLLQPAAIDAASDIVSPDDFYRDSHRRIYQTILAMHAAGEPVDALTLTAKLGDQAKVRVYELAALVPAAGNVGHYARIVKDAATRRALITLAAEAVKEAHTGGDVDRIEQLAYTINNRAAGSVDLDLGVPGYITNLQRLRDNPSELIGVPTGFTAVDDLTQGFSPGNLVIVGARPSMGKSALALCVSAHLLGRDMPVGLLTLEMSKPEIAQRLVSIGASLPGDKLRDPKLLTDDEWTRAQDAAARLHTLPLYVHEAGTITPLELRSHVRRLKAKVPDLALMIVDYLQLMTTGGRHSGDNRVQEVSEISRMLKVLARDMGVPIMALSQLSRSVEQRTDKRPMLSDLRESGSIEQDADVVLLLYRPSYYATGEESPPPVEFVECHIAKNRNGRTGLARLVFVKDQARFSNPARPHLVGDVGSVAA